jgi:hypothetical protein
VKPVTGKVMHMKSRDSPLKLMNNQIIENMQPDASNRGIRFLNAKKERRFVWTR